MNRKPPSAAKLARRLKWQLLPFIVGWLASVFLVGFGVWFYMVIVNTLGVPRLPGVNPILAVVIGMTGGVCAVAVERWRLRRYFEAQARAIAFRERHWKLGMLSVLPFLAIYGATLGILYLAAGIFAGILFPLISGSLFAPFIFAYPAYLRVYERAVQLAVEASDEPSQEPASVPRPGRIRVLAWANVLGIVSVVLVLGLGAWLQWGLPFMAQREPKHYETKTQPGGMAVRLTYGADADSPALSPDGRLVAYVRAGPLMYGHLEIMRADGRDKRAIASDGDSGAWPALSYPLAWSPDESRLLVLGEQSQPVTTLEDLLKHKFERDLWTVDVATGAASRLTRDGNFIAAVWAPATRKIAALEDVRMKKGARLWLMDENGGNRQEVRGRYGGAVHPWHDGREVVAAGWDESAGIWSVDAKTGRATRLSDIKAYGVIPLDAERLVFAAHGRAYPPGKWATSIGILHVQTGEVQWVTRDLQGGAADPCLVPKESLLVFALSEADGCIRDLWALRLTDGKLKRLTWGERVSGFAVNPDGTDIFYVTRSEEAARVRIFDLGFSIWRLTRKGAPAPP